MTTRITSTPRGTAEPSGRGSHRDLIEQVLFTVPGERVNRPTFGSGLLQLVFAPNSDTLAAATQFSVQASLQQWLGSLVQIEQVKVESDESTLHVAVQYSRSSNAGTSPPAIRPGGAGVTTQYLCRNERRRSAVRNPDGQAVLNGIELLEVTAGDPSLLKIHFIHPVPGQAGGMPPRRQVTDRPESGHRGWRSYHDNVQVEGVRAAANVLAIKMSALGDFSIYTLRLVQPRKNREPLPGFDPALSQIEFSFRVACPSDFDCADPSTAPLSAAQSIRRSTTWPRTMRRSGS